MSTSEGDIGRYWRDYAAKPQNSGRFAPIVAVLANLTLVKDRTARNVAPPL
jgi:hypothetical protein